MSDANDFLFMSLVINLQQASMQHLGKIASPMSGEMERNLEAAKHTIDLLDCLAAKTKGNRPGCLCAESRDIGAYDSCPHGCVYCYAVRAPKMAKARFRAHDADADVLVPPAHACG